MDFDRLRAWKRPGLLAACLALPALFLLHCAHAFLERAQDPAGFSCGLGALADHTLYPWGDPDEWSTHSRIVPSAFARYRFKPPVSISLQGGIGRMYGKSIAGIYPIQDSQGLFLADAKFSVKVQPWRANAIRLGLGAFATPSWDHSSLEFSPDVSITYLHDFGEWFTVALDFGLPVLAGVGLVFHPRFSRHFVGYLAAGTSTILSAAAGAALEYDATPGPEENR